MAKKKQIEKATATYGVLAAILMFSLSMIIILIKEMVTNFGLNAIWIMMLIILSSLIILAIDFFARTKNK